MKALGLTAGALAACALLVPGCGGGGGALSAESYKKKLGAIEQELSHAFPALDDAQRTRNVAQIAAGVAAFAQAYQKAGDRVAELNAPKDAAAANASLAHGNRDVAAAVRSIVPRLAAAKTADEAIRRLAANPAAVKGGKEITKALMTLGSLGYI